MSTLLLSGGKKKVLNTPFFFFLIHYCSNICMKNDLGETLIIPSFCVLYNNFCSFRIEPRSQVEPKELTEASWLPWASFLLHSISNQEYAQNTKQHRDTCFPEVKHSGLAPTRNELWFGFSVQIASLTSTS